LVVSKIELVKDKTHKVEGTLTIKNLSHPVTFPVEVEAKGDEMTAKGKLTFDRSLFDVRYGSGKFNPDLLKDKLISDNVDLEFTLVTKKTQSKS
jgi:polyisoprenoid-binding protein YceI